MLVLQIMPRFNAAPVLYSDLPTFHRVKFGEAAELNKEQISGIVVRNNTLNDITTNEKVGSDCNRNLH